MKKNWFVKIPVALVVLLLFAGADWTTEKAKEQAFQNVQTKIDVTKYPSQDPNFEENQAALKQDNKHVGGRFVTKATAGNYVVFEEIKEGEGSLPAQTMFYNKNGHLISIRLSPQKDYPRVAYIYCVQNECEHRKGGGPAYQSGSLMSVSLHLENGEMFYFTDGGELIRHFLNRKPSGTLTPMRKYDTVTSKV